MRRAACPDYAECCARSGRARRPRQTHAHGVWFLRPGAIYVERRAAAGGSTA